MFPEAINTSFPKIEIQLCVIHQIRNALKYVASKDQKVFMKELKEVYQAPTEETALLNLYALEDRLRSKYSLTTKSWRNDWENLATFLSIHKKLERLFTLLMRSKQCIAGSGKSQNQSLFFLMTMLSKKMLYLAYRDLYKKIACPP